MKFLNPTLWEDSFQVRIMARSPLSFTPPPSPDKLLDLRTLTPTIQSDRILHALCPDWATGVTIESHISFSGRLAARLTPLFPGILLVLTPLLRCPHLVELPHAALSCDLPPIYLFSTCTLTRTFRIISTVWSAFTIFRISIWVQLPPRSLNLPTTVHSQQRESYT